MPRIPFNDQDQNCRTELNNDDQLVMPRSNHESSLRYSDFSLANAGTQTVSPTWSRELLSVAPSSKLEIVPSLNEAALQSLLVSQQPVIPAGPLNPVDSERPHHAIGNPFQAAMEDRQKLSEQEQVWKVEPELVVESEGRPSRILQFDASHRGNDATAFESTLPVCRNSSEIPHPSASYLADTFIESIGRDEGSSAFRQPPFGLLDDPQSVGASQVQAALPEATTKFPVAFQPVGMTAQYAMTSQVQSMVGGQPDGALQQAVNVERVEGTLEEVKETRGGVSFSKFTTSTEEQKFDEVDKEERRFPLDDNAESSSVTPSHPRIPPRLPPPFVGSTSNVVDYPNRGLDDSKRAAASSTVFSKFSSYGKKALASSALNTTHQMLYKQYDYNPDE